MAKKKKRDDSQQDSQPHNQQLGNEPSCVNSNSDDKTDKKKKKKRKHKEEKCIELKERPTVSIALPGSIINNAQSLELATRLAGQIARAAAIFRIEEIVVFDNKISSSGDSSFMLPDSSDENESGSAFLIRILRYLETPQYLRKTLCPWHNSLKLAGLLPPLDAPHHLRKHEWGTYREGVILKESMPESGGSLADVGLNKNVVIDQVVEPGTRVTVAMGTNRQLDDKPRQVVSSSKPREEGMYWGYKVRYAANISSVFQSCPYQGGYDHLIGTSEHGLFFKSSELTIPPFRHLLIAFGGLAGLEECFEEDKNLKGKKPSDVFHSYLNVCPNQGSRTIRTEEAVFISLQYFQEPIDRAVHSAEYLVVSLCNTNSSHG